MEARLDEAHAQANQVKKDALDADIADKTAGLAVDTGAKAISRSSVMLERMCATTQRNGAQVLCGGGRLDRSSTVAACRRCAKKV